MDTNLLNRTLSEISHIIRADWRNVNYAAEPYLAAMSALGHIDDPYGFDSGRSIVLYFLSNAQTWRGETAKAVKAELKRRAKY